MGSFTQNYIEMTKTFYFFIFTLIAYRAYRRTLSNRTHIMRHSLSSWNESGAPCRAVNIVFQLVGSLAELNAKSNPWFWIRRRDENAFVLHMRRTCVVSVIKLSWNMGRMLYVLHQTFPHQIKCIFNEVFFLLSQQQLHSVRFTMWPIWVLKTFQGADPWLQRTWSGP